MSSESSKAVIQAWFDHLARGDVATAMGLMAQDMRYTVTGSTPLSGTFVGMEEISNRLLGPLFERLDAPIVFTLRELIAEGERVVALANGEARGRHGAYDNTYCFVFSVRDGAIASVEEYMDTVLVETALYGRTLG